MKKILTSLKYRLQLISAVWAVPIAITVFILCGFLFQFFFGPQAGIYDITFFQPLFLASAVVIAAANFAMGGLYFTFRGLFRYLYGKKNKDEKKVVNASKIDFQKFTPWQRIVISFSVFFLYLLAIIIVFLKLV